MFANQTSNSSYQLDCVFCDIVAKKISANIVFEDDHVIAFLDIAPLTKGHVLVIPKSHHATLPEMPPSIMAHIGSVLPKISAGVIAGVGATDFNVMQNNGKRAGQVVFHTHFHIFPRTEEDPPGFGKMVKLERPKIDENEAIKIANAIRAKL